MIISDVHKYVFVQVPHTASTALENLLIEKFDGRRILRKHSYLDELYLFNKSAFRNYYVFGCVRNPLDERISIYQKYKTDHLGLYRGDLQINGGIKGGFVSRKISRAISHRELSFDDYFRRFVRLQYFSPISIFQNRYDKIMRYETLQDDFNQVLHNLSLRSARIPVSNRTAGRAAETEEWYCDAEVRKRAQYLFGPFMAEFGYVFPSSWCPYSALPVKARATHRAIRRVQWGLRAIRHFHKVNI